MRSAQLKKGFHYRILTNNLNAYWQHYKTRPKDSSKESSSDENYLGTTEGFLNEGLGPESQRTFLGWLKTG